MFYHAALLFDHNGFAREARVLARAVEGGDYVPLHQRVSEIAGRMVSEEFFLRRYGYGGPLKLPQSVIEVQSSPYRDSEIGQWLMIVMSMYMKPCPISIGYNWGNLVNALQALEWQNADIERPFYGLPTGLLVTPAASTQHSNEVTHSDPYWKWIRLLYTYNEGGWLPSDECERLFTLLRQAEPQIMILDYKGPPELTEEQKENWKRSVQQGYADALTMLSTAMKETGGLYMVILWEWDDSDR